ncbi:MULTISPECIES: hypothetical protein [unclassified Corynebacterium]|uniref:hypothetical protein n=1 Tax=unclassified Corynebacterium TaxID=2624378 RepID=UPI0029CA0E12|nr:MULTISPECIES: hypothetical protein [unclassified Corynebacterium]WPF65495.1 hypothetical protein OLX12_07880 [Corynebacterium sp. 22KM0430]WPF67991.1 hypothetical protein OLW90_07875 [Corynebacterium sp. 21KM1197]
MQAGRAQNNATKNQAASFPGPAVRRAEPQPKQAAKPSGGVKPDQRFYAKPSEAVKPKPAGYAPPVKKPEQRYSAPSSPKPAQRQAAPSGKPVTGPKQVAARPQDKGSSGAKVINPDPLARPVEDPEGFKFSDWLRSWRESQERD